MPLKLSILDETTLGEEISAGEFQFDDSPLTVREIIRFRVRQEADRFNTSVVSEFRGLVRPEESERVLNGEKARPILDWEKQYAKALAAFRGNGFLILIDDRQVMDLDETIYLTPHTKIAFLKLVPLIGG